MAAVPTPRPRNGHERDGLRPHFAPTRVVRQNGGDVTVTATLWYTQSPTGSPSSSGKVPVGLIAGGIGGGIVLCVVAVILWKWWDRVRTRRSREEWRRNMEIHQNRRNAKGLTRLRTASGNKDDAPSSTDDHSSGSTKVHLEDTNGFQLVSLSNTTPKKQPPSTWNDSQTPPPKPMASYTPTRPSRTRDSFIELSSSPHSSYAPSSPLTPSSARALLSPTSPNAPSYRSSNGRSSNSVSPPHPESP